MAIERASAKARVSLAPQTHDRALRAGWWHRCARARAHAKSGRGIKASVVIDNRSGSGGTIGCEMVVKAAADGYTLAFDTASYTTRAVLHNLPFHPINDITAITQAFTSGYILVLPPGNSVPAKSVKELTLRQQTPAS